MSGTSFSHAAGTTGVATMMTAGSLSWFGTVEPIDEFVETIAILVTVPLVAVSFAGIVIVGYDAPLTMTSDRWHETLAELVTPLHDHPGAEIVFVVSGATPVGSVSVTVVVPDVEAGPLLVAMIV